MRKLFGLGVAGIAAGAVAGVLACAALPAQAQGAYPDRPIRIIAPFAPGGPVDIIARVVGQKMGELLGQPMVVDNRAGAGGNVGAVAVAKAAPDGYTVLVTSSAFVVNVSLFSNPGYDIAKDFLPVANLASQPNILVVHPNLPVKTLPELVAYGKSNKLAFATPGSGTTPHLTGEAVYNLLLKMDLTAIHFRGAGPAVAAVVGGEPTVGSMALAAPLPQVKAGKLRALAVSSSKRLPQFPDVPTLTELGYPAIQDYTWVGMMVPAGTPAAIVQKLNETANKALQSPDVKERLDGQAFEAAGGTPQQFADYMKVEVAKWGKVVKETGAKPD
jgi:tripartite-type tricarboxylate transporter receptor subunit TctC